MAPHRFIDDGVAALKSLMKSAQRNYCVLDRRLLIYGLRKPSAPKVKIKAPAKLKSRTVEEVVKAPSLVAVLEGV